jgi:hypothetical protein
MCPLFQRPSWIPYFDDGSCALACVRLAADTLAATAIIFLAPISAFDQVRPVLPPPACIVLSARRPQFLEEDTRVNRIDDSLQLWTAICTNKLLAKAALILLLNKVRPSPI